MNVRRSITGRVEDWCGAHMGSSPAPAASNGANGFPVRRSPVCFASWVMGPMGLTRDAQIALGAAVLALNLVVYWRVAALSRRDRRP
jgi:hypothetical protein